jgi:hypothetical protein
MISHALIFTSLGLVCIIFILFFIILFFNANPVLVYIYI